MGCASTLSWSGMGLASLPSPVVRRRDPRERGGLRPPAGESIRAGEGRAGEEVAAGAGLTRGEVRPLEIDWSQTVRRCMDGDSGAWSELVRTHHRRVYGLCYRFTGNPADAEDLTQDVFL